MRKTALIIGLALVLGLGQAAVLRAHPQAPKTAGDEALFREAKLLVYDKDWRTALDKIEELGEKYPSSPFVGQALFYKGECLNGLGGREKDALRAYKDYIRSDEAKANLVEEAEGRIVDQKQEILFQIRGVGVDRISGKAFFYGKVGKEKIRQLRRQGIPRSLSTASAVHTVPVRSA